MRARGLTTRMVGVGLLMLAVVATAFTILLSAIGDLRASSHWTEHPVSVLSVSSELQNTMGDFTATTRNYVDHPSEQQLERWGQLRLQTFSKANELQRMVRDNPEQTATARTIADRIRSLAGADGVVSVIQLLAREPRARDEDTVQLLSTIGEEVGHVVERRIARIEPTA